MDEDVENTSMRTRYGLYEFPMMPFGLCNAPLTFMTLMNLIFHEKLDEFMIIYVDNILVYSKIIEEHVEHVEYVSNKLHENKVFSNKAKNEFPQKEMDFLGHILS